MKIKYFFPALLILFSVFSRTSEGQNDYEAPALLYPVNKAENISLTPTMKWSKVPNNFSYNNDVVYRLQVSYNRDFTNLLLDWEVKNNYKKLPKLNYRNTYYWRISAHSKNRSTVWSDAHVFYTIKSHPYISKQTGKLTSCHGENPVLSVHTNSPGITYRWFKNGMEISGAVKYHYEITGCSPDDSGIYWCRLDKEDDETTFSEDIPVKIVSEIIIDKQPDSRFFKYGEDAVFKCSARAVNLPAENPLIYQWFRGQFKLQNSDKYSGVNTNELTIRNIEPEDYGEIFSLRIKNTFCDEYIHSELCGVIPLYIFESRPADATVCMDENIDFSVKTASHVKSYHDVFYRWKKNGTGLVNNERISGANSTKLSISKANKNDEGEYKLAAYVMPDQKIDETSAFHLQVNSTPEIVRQSPLRQTHNFNDEVTLFVETRTNKCSYQWFKTDAPPVPGAVNNYYQFTLKSGNEGGYYCLAYNECGSVKSERIIVGVVSEFPEYEMYEDITFIIPNPIKEKFTLNFANPQDSYYSIILYDGLGKNAGTLFNGYLKAGGQALDLSVKDLNLNQGVYFLYLQGQNKSYTKPVLILK